MLAAAISLTYLPQNQKLQQTDCVDRREDHKHFAHRVLIAKGKLKN